MSASLDPLWVSQDQVKFPRLFQAQHPSFLEHLIPVFNVITFSRWKRLHHWGFRSNVLPWFSLLWCVWWSLLCTPLRCFRALGASSKSLGFKCLESNCFPLQSLSRLTVTEMFSLKPFCRVAKSWLMFKIACLCYENRLAFLLEAFAFNKGAEWPETVLIRGGQAAHLWKTETCTCVDLSHPVNPWKSSWPGTKRDFGP